MACWAAALLHLDQERHFRKPVEDLGQLGIYAAPPPEVAGSPVRGESCARVGPLRLTGRHRVQETGPIGGAIEGGVVEHQRNPIGGDPDVELQGVGPLGQRQLKGG